MPSDKRGQISGLMALLHPSKVHVIAIKHDEESQKKRWLEEVYEEPHTCCSAFGLSLFLMQRAGSIEKSESLQGRGYKCQAIKGGKFQD